MSPRLAEDCTVGSDHHQIVAVRAAVHIGEGTGHKEIPDHPMVEEAVDGAVAVHTEEGIGRMEAFAPQAPVAVHLFEEERVQVPACQVQHEVHQIPAKCF